jgi:signal transduction histidine kinase/CHASE3 domain sensor protein
MAYSKVKTPIFILTGIILALLIATMLFSLFTIHRLKSNLSVQVHTTTVLVALDDNLISLLNAETGERGFMATADTNYLQPYYLALQNITSNTTRLRILTKDNLIQQRHLDTLEQLINKELLLTGSLISLKKQGDEKTMFTISREGKGVMDRIREVNQSMQAEELVLREERTTNTNQSIDDAQVIYIAESIFSLLVTLFLAYTVIKELGRRKKIEQELAISGERFFKIFDENPISMSLSEVGTDKIVFANDLFYKTFGYSKNEVIGHRTQELKLISPEEEARIYPILLGYLNETRSIAELQALTPKESEELIIKLKEAMGNKGLDVLYTRKNGETFYAIVSYDMIEIDNKKYTITSYQDITEQKNAENKIIAYSIELERQNKEIEQFAYVASHDLQEPLRTISNFSTLLTEKLETNSDKELHEYVSYINGGAERMSRLIFDLLEYSRIRKDIGKERIDCTKLVSEVLTDLSASIRESEAEIHTEKLPVVNGYSYLKSVFQNLISNAIKFKKEGTHPIISISAKDTGKEFLFSIKDNGIGIEEGYRERIFLIFQRLHTRSEYEGTGIGLSQCRKIIELHGGRIWVESEPAIGSTFNFTIPKK